MIKLIICRTLEKKKNTKTHATPRRTLAVIELLTTSNRAMGTLSSSPEDRSGVGQNTGRVELRPAPPLICYPIAKLQHSAPFCLSAWALAC